MSRVQAEVIREALVRPSLWLGCDPVLLIALGTLCGTVGVGAGVGYREPLLVLLGLVLFSVGRSGLLAMARKDPQLRAIWFRRAQYRTAYASRPRWDASNRTRRRWT